MGDCVIATLEGPGIIKSQCPTCKQPGWKKDLVFNHTINNAVEQARPGLESFIAHELEEQALRIAKFSRKATAVARDGLGQIPSALAPAANTEGNARPEGLLRRSQQPGRKAAAGSRSPTAAPPAAAIGKTASLASSPYQPFIPRDPPTPDLFSEGWARQMLALPTPSPASLERLLQEIALLEEAIQLCDELPCEGHAAGDQQQLAKMVLAHTAAVEPVTVVELQQPTNAVDGSSTGTKVLQPVQQNNACGPAAEPAAAVVAADAAIAAHCGKGLQGTGLAGIGRRGADDGDEPHISGRKRRKGPSGRSIPALPSADLQPSSSAGRGGSRNNTAQPQPAAAGGAPARGDAGASSSLGGPANAGSDSRRAPGQIGSSRGNREAATRASSSLASLGAAQPRSVCDSEDALEPPQTEQVQQAVSLPAATKAQQPGSRGCGDAGGGEAASDSAAAAQPLWQRARAAQQPGWGPRRRAERQMQQAEKLVDALTNKPSQRAMRQRRLQRMQDPQPLEASTHGQQHPKRAQHAQPEEGEEHPPHEAQRHGEQDDVLEAQQQQEWQQQQQQQQLERQQQERDRPAVGIGDRVWVKWTDGIFIGTVTKYSAGQGEYHIEYLDGDKQWHTLEEEEWGLTKSHSGDQPRTKQQGKRRRQRQQDPYRFLGTEEGTKKRTGKPEEDGMASSSSSESSSDADSHCSFHSEDGIEEADQVGKQEWQGQKQDRQQHRQQQRTGREQVSHGSPSRRGSQLRAKPGGWRQRRKTAGAPSKAKGQPVVVSDSSEEDVAVPGASPAMPPRQATRRQQQGHQQQRQQARLSGGSGLGAAGGWAAAQVPDHLAEEAPASGSKAAATTTAAAGLHPTSMPPEQRGLGAEAEDPEARELLSAEQPTVLPTFRGADVPHTVPVLGTQDAASMLVGIAAGQDNCMCSSGPGGRPNQEQVAAPDTLCLPPQQSVQLQPLKLAVDDEVAPSNWPAAEITLGRQLHRPSRLQPPSEQGTGCDFRESSPAGQREETGQGEQAEAQQGPSASACEVAPQLSVPEGGSGAEGARQHGCPSSATLAAEPQGERDAEADPGGQEQLQSLLDLFAEEPGGGHAACQAAGAAAAAAHQCTTDAAQATTPTSPPPKVLVLVAPKAEQQNKVHSCISKLRDAGKARLELKVSDTTTHVIVETDDRLVATGRSMKYMRGVLSGCWVVSYSWIDACLAAGAWLPEKNFEAQGDPHAQTGAPRKGRLRRDNDGPNLFQGVSAYVAQSSSKGRDGSELVALLESGGAKVLARLPPAPEQHANLRLLVAGRDNATVARELKVKTGRPVLKWDWVFDSISHWQLQKTIGYCYK
ncbi:hypothetical protein N2152v2_007729 [Parachlorella kessleri]